MSGTPTTGANSRDALSQLQKLFVFLRHKEWGLFDHPNRDPNHNNNHHHHYERARERLTAARSWESAITVPFLQRQPEAKLLLVNLLKGVVVRHTKADIELPPVVRTSLTQY